MKLPALAALAGVAAAPSITSAATASPLISSAGPPCVAKMVKIHGKLAAVECGPATATMTVGGKTYSFTGGYCEAQAKSKTTLILDLGTVLQSFPFEKSGRPHFNLTVVGSPRTAGVSAIFGGRYLLPVGTTSAGSVAVSGAISGSGTFVGKSGARFSGSWNCHGVIYKL